MEPEQVPSQHHPLQLIRKKELAELLTINVWTLDNWRKKGHFPKPIVLSDQVLVWRLTDIDRWLQEMQTANASWKSRMSGPDRPKKTTLPVSKRKRGHVPGRAAANA